MLLPSLILLILQLKYPSALSSFDQITNYAKGKRIALFLDYDGTLSPIVDNPDCAFMSENVCDVIFSSILPSITSILPTRFLIM